MEEKTFGVAVKAIVKFEDKFLIIKKSLIEDVAPETYDLPGGRLEFGEKPVNALTREVFEETGLNILNPKPTRVWSFSPKENFQLIGITFLCESENNKVNLSEEHTEYKWLTHEEIKEMDLPDWFKKEFEGIQ